MTIRLRLLWLLPSMVVVACGGEPTTTGPVERVVASPLKFQVEAEGQIQSAHATPLPVPGQQWTRRQPIWLLSDGAHVETGALIARFSPEQSELELAQFLIDIQRNQLSRIGKEAELGGAQSRVDIDLVDVATRMGIAHRYADADLAEYFSRNEVLDAIDDLHFLDTRQHILDWKRGQFARRGAAEIAVLDAQRGSHQRNAQQRRAADDGRATARLSAGLHGP
jgi:HlyD family secretion protein